MITCEDEDCEAPATHKVRHTGCPFCGGSDCGDSPDTEYFCGDHAAGQEGAELLTEDERR